MTLREELAQEMEATRQDFHHLLDSVPEALYHHPSDNPAWTISDVLYHITLGPSALRLEIWAIHQVPGLFQLTINNTTSRIFNWGNILFTRQGQRFTREKLSKAYEKGHAGILSSLMRMNENDFQKTVIYPETFVTELAGEVTIERLFRYVKGHFDVHAEQIRKALERTQ